MTWELHPLVSYPVASSCLGASLQVETALATILGASRNEFAAEVPIKRLLLLLEMARQGQSVDEPQVTDRQERLCISQLE